MSQRTRARTTGAATRKPRKSDDPVSVSATGMTTASKEDTAPAAPAVAAGDAVSALAPETLARTLRAVAAELERDPALARRVADAITTPPASAGIPQAGGDGAGAATGVGGMALDDQPKLRSVNRNFRPKLVTGASPDLGAGIPDPFALISKRGEDGLRLALEGLRLGSLRAIVREHGLDPKGVLAQQNDAEKLRAAILRAARKGRKQ